MIGSTVQEMVTTEISLGTYTGWELQQLQNAGRLAGVDFFVDGAVVSNPF